MKFSDLFQMCLTNLWRRKLRTFLTVLGVVIGTASIVVMISLGLGLSKATMSQIEQYGGLTTITVNPGDSYNGASQEVSVGNSGSNSKKDPTAGLLSDETVEQIAGITNVSFVSPVLNLYVIAKQGSYEGSFSLNGMSAEALTKMDIPLAEGSTLPISGDVLQFLYGNQIITNFTDVKTKQSYYETGVLPKVDLMNSPVFIIFDSDAYYASQNSGSSDSMTKSPGEGSDTPPTEPPKKYVIASSGLVAGGPDDYNEFCYTTYCDIDALKMQLKKVFKNKVIPGQPTNSNGKPYKKWFYESLYVSVDKMEDMESVQKEITNLGYNAYSNADWINQMNDQYRTVQAVLGGIGAVALFVAAIGIANTMMMSIYERTKEIGIMKVLGCALPRIRDMFLIEAAMIGLIGGMAGLVLSYGISAIINAVMRGSYETGVSYIPIWLTLAALVFAVLVGMLAGLFPALRAMRLSALSALRNE